MTPCVRHIWVSDIHCITFMKTLLLFGAEFFLALTDGFAVSGILFGSRKVTSEEARDALSLGANMLSRTASLSPGSSSVP